jgi:uncharacterized membrane protein YkoI
MKNTFKTAFVVTGVALILNTPSAYADDDAQEIAAITKEFGLITLDQAKVKALAAKPGVVTDADLDDRDFGKGWDYEFEIVDADGREWEVDIDAKTGAVGKVRRDWF